MVASVTLRHVLPATECGGSGLAPDLAAAALVRRGYRHSLVLGSWASSRGAYASFPDTSFFLFVIFGTTLPLRLSNTLIDRL